MRSDHLANGVGVDQSGKEDEGNKMLIQNDRLQVEIRRDKSPGHEERYQSKEGDSRLLSALVTDFDHVLGAGNR